MIGLDDAVQGGRPQFWQQMPDFPDLPALNAWLEQRCQNLWRETPQIAFLATLPAIFRNPSFIRIAIMLGCSAMLNAK
jgi:hypothetical protein